MLPLPVTNSAFCNPSRHRFFPWSKTTSRVCTYLRLVGGVQIFWHLLTCSLLRSTPEHTYLPFALSTCWHIRCNVPHVFLPWSNIPSRWRGVNVIFRARVFVCVCVRVRVHLFTCSMLRSSRFPHMITHTFGPGGTQCLTQKWEKKKRVVKPHTLPWVSKTSKSRCPRTYVNLGDLLTGIYVNFY